VPPFLRVKKQWKQVKIIYSNHLFCFQNSEEWSFKYPTTIIAMCFNFSCSLGASEGTPPRFTLPLPVFHQHHSVEDSTEVWWLTLAG